MKLLQKVKDWLYSISYHFENLAEKVDSFIEKRKSPKESALSASMKQFYDETLLNGAKELEVDKFFPEKKMGGKVVFVKYDKIRTDFIPFTEGLGKYDIEPLYYNNEEEQG